MINEIDLEESFRCAGVFSTDTVMIHGDAGVAAQFRSIEPNFRLGHLISQIVKFFSKGGTVVVPTFSYSFTKGEVFNRADTPSAVGQFSEAFRNYPGVYRSRHPIFSVASIGKYAQAFENSRIDDCFGEGTAIELLNRFNGKIICMGCDFSRITFVHYVEQKYGVQYRYFKNFNGFLVEGNTKVPLTTTYYVRDINLDTGTNLTRMKNASLESGFLNISKVGRFPMTAICATDFLSLANILLKEDKYALIQDGKKSNEI